MTRSRRLSALRDRGLEARLQLVRKAARAGAGLDEEIHGGLLARNALEEERNGGRRLIADGHRLREARGARVESRIGVAVKLGDRVACAHLVAAAFAQEKARGRIHAIFLPR